MSAGEQVPPRRSGHGCGYEGRQELGFAKQRLGAALTDLARDPDPAARCAGVDLAEEATRVLLELTSRAEAATSAAQRITEALPGLGARIAQARQQLRPTKS
ncbi:hypothetical protein [Actinoplanes sp. NPDC051494]|uniref:hypothetical protein n=1 Tax=Actinoplanes sp. NPDC051494 TaxID=3363907 RepID=UPI0037B87D01